MNNPIDTNEFKHYLNFISLGFPNLYQITEPSGFDVANFVLKQNSERYGRDIFYGNETENLKFTKVVAEYTGIEQVIHPDGTISKYLDMGLNWILETKNRFGYEGEIEHILKKDGISFTVGLLDLANPDTDGFTYFGCNVIQNTQIANYKKQLDTSIDLLSTKNIKDETITAASILKFLRKALPLYGTANYSVKDVFTHSTSVNIYYNPATILINEGLDNAITPPNTYNVVNHGSASGGSGIPLFDAIENRKIFTATKRTKNIKIKISNVFLNVEMNNTGMTNELTVAYGNVALTDWTVNTLESQTGVYEFNIVDGNYEVTIPLLEIGQSIWIYFSAFRWDDNFTTTAVTLNNNMKIDISGSQISVNTVVNGVRYIDVLKQCSKFINNLPINAPIFDIEGEHYNNVCYNRSLLSTTEKPFITSFKDASELAMTIETNADYEIHQDKISFIPFPEYYNSSEIGVFGIQPSKEYKESWNERFKINNFKLSYETFETNRLSKNTANDIHTESEWSIPNIYVENKLERNIKYIRSGFSAQAMVDLEIKTPQTADENDDKVYINKIVPLPENSFSTIGAILSLSISDGKLQILNRKSTDNDGDVAINWKQLGLNVGDSFEIIEGSNIGSYTIDSITRNLLIVTPITFTPTITGDYYILFKYFYTDVFWQTETNEEITAENLENGTEYPNLKYTLRRNIINWESYLNSACLFRQDKKIKNLFFKNNPELTTQEGGGTVYTEKGDIIISSLSTQIIGAKIYDLEVYAFYSEIIDLLNAIKAYRGFVRCHDINNRVIKGFIQELDYTWKSGKLTLKLEEKYEADLILLNYTDGILTVNDTPYNLSGAVNWWKITGDYFQCFDSNQIAICNIRHFSNVSLNGTIYDSAEELHEALINL